MDALRKLVEFQGAVIKGGGQAEAVLHERLLPRAVAAVHGAHLRQRHMALIHEKQEVLREVVEQGHRRAARRTVRDHARIVLDAAAVAQLLHHFDVVVRTLTDALRLDQLVVLLKVPHALVALGTDALDRGGELFLCGHVMARGIDGRVVEDAGRRAGDDVDLADAVDLISEKLDSDGPVVGIGREDLHRVAADAEHVALEGDVVSLVADLNELAQQLVKAACLPRPQGYDHVGVVDRITEAVDAGDRRHHDHVPPFEETGGRAVAQAFYLVVDGAVLLDEGVGVRDIGLRLVIIVITYEVLHCVFREEFLELAAQLRRQRLVVREHQRGAVEPRDDVCHGKGLARTGHAEKHLLVETVFDPTDQIVYGLRLIPGGSEVGYEFESVHKYSRFVKSFYYIIPKRKSQDIR